MKSRFRSGSRAASSTPLWIAWEQQGDGLVGVCDACKEIVLRAAPGLREDADRVTRHVLTCAGRRGAPT